MLLKVKKNEKNVNKLDDNGMAPLHYAARYNQLACIKYLIEKAEAGEKQKPSFVTLVTYRIILSCQRYRKRLASHCSTYSVAMVLVDIIVKDKQGLTPLHYAAKKKEGGSAQV